MNVFCYFPKFELQVFREIAYDDSLRQCLTSRRGKVHEKISGAQIWAKLGPKIKFFVVFSGLAYQLSFKLHRMMAWIYVQLLVEVEFSKIIWPQNWTRNQVFYHFLKFASLVFLDIAQDGSLGQCLTSSRAETSEKNILWPKLGPNRPKLVPSYHPFLLY